MTPWHREKTAWKEGRVFRGLGRGGHRKTMKTGEVHIRSAPDVPVRREHQARQRSRPLITGFSLPPSHTAEPDGWADDSLTGACLLERWTQQSWKNGSKCSQISKWKNLSAFLVLPAYFPSHLIFFSFLLSLLGFFSPASNYLQLKIDKILESSNWKES